MAAIIVRNLPDELMSSLKGMAKANKRSTEAEVREILKAAVSKTEQSRRRPGSELAAIGKSVGGVDLKIVRDPRPIEPADFC